MSIWTPFLCWALMAFAWLLVSFLIMGLGLYFIFWFKEEEKAEGKKESASDFPKEAGPAFAILMGFVCFVTFFYPMERNPEFIFITGFDSQHRLRDENGIIWGHLSEACVGQQMRVEFAPFSMAAGPWTAQRDYVVKYVNPQKKKEPAPATPKKEEPAEAAKPSEEKAKPAEEAKTKPAEKTTPDYAWPIPEVKVDKIDEMKDDDAK